MRVLILTIFLVYISRSFAVKNVIGVNGEEIELLLSLQNDSGATPTDIQTLQKAALRFLEQYTTGPTLRIGLITPSNGGLLSLGSKADANKRIEEITQASNVDDIDLLTRTLVQINVAGKLMRSTLTAQRIAVVLGKFNTHGRILHQLEDFATEMKQLKENDIKLIFIGYGTVDSFWEQLLFSYGMPTYNFEYEFQINMVMAMVHEYLVPFYKRWSRNKIESVVLEGKYCTELGTHKSIEIGISWKGYNCVQYECNKKGPVITDIQCVDAGGLCVPRGQKYQALIGQKINTECECTVKHGVALEDCTP